MNKYLLAICLIAITILPSAAQKKENKKEKTKENPITVKIKLSAEKIKKLRELKIIMTITNKGKQSEQFLFERVDATTSVPLATYCNIYNSKGQSVVKYATRTILDSLYKTNRPHDDTYYTLEPTEWIMKEYSAGELVMLDTTICKKFQLPKDQYTLQLRFHDAISNKVSFSVE